MTTFVDEINYLSSIKRYDYITAGGVQNSRARVVKN